MTSEDVSEDDLNGLIQRLRALLHPLRLRMDMHAAEPVIREAIDAIERLTAEREEAREAARTWENEAERRSRRYEKDVVALRAERDALKADAERWRYFVSTRPAGTHGVIFDAIDAARGGEKQDA